MAHSSFVTHSLTIILPNFEFKKGSHTFPYSEQSDLFAIGMIFSELLAQCPVSNIHRIALLNIKQQMIADDPSQRKNAQHYIEVLATWNC